MASVSYKRRFTSIPTYLKVLLLLWAYDTEAASCPHPCQCQDEENLEVNCTDKLLMTLPTLSRSTLTLDLSHNALGPIINTSFPQMPNLTSIDLSHNALSRLLACTFQGLLGLKTVRLHNNRLTSLPDSLFTDANKVEHLDVSHNLIVEIPDDTFRNLPELKSLDMSHNRIVELMFGPRFQVPRHIEVLDFSHNLIENIREDAFNMAQGWEGGIKRTMNLAYCRISSIESGALRNIPDLEDLSLSGNSGISEDNLASVVKELETGRLEKLSLAHMNLTSIAPLFTQVTEMAPKFLNVSFNAITDLPANVFSTIRSLQVLDVSHNTVPALTAGFADLVNLCVLNISYNKIESFQGEAVSALTKLHTLDVCHNMLADPDTVNFSPLTRLTFLKVNNNLLSAVALPSNTSNLQYLDYHSNSIKDFVGLDDAVKLEFFDISDNDLESVKGFLFKGARYLKMANFSKNSIITLDPRAFLPQSPLHVDLSHNFLRELQFSNWVATQRLYLNHNQLENVDVQAFYGMTGLEVLDLAENKLISPHEHLLQYLTSLKYLNLSHNSINNGLWFDLFRNLELLETLDLGFNSINHLNESMFQPLPNLQVLSLRNNSLEIIIPRVFRDLSNIKQIDLSHNPFHCTCDMLAFRDWLFRTKVPIIGLYSINSTAYTCKAPSSRSGTHVTKWDVEDFECNKSMLYMIVFGSIGLVLIVAGVVGSGAFRLYLAWKRRRQAKQLVVEYEERLRRAKKVDLVRMNSHEIAEEIQEAMERKERRGQRQLETLDRPNGYVPWPGKARRSPPDDETKGERGSRRDGSPTDRSKKSSRKESGSGKQYNRLIRDEWDFDHRDRRRERERGSPMPTERRTARDTHADRRSKDDDRRERRREGEYINMGHYDLSRRGRSPGREYPGEYPRRGLWRDHGSGFFYIREDPARNGRGDPFRYKPYIISPSTHTLPDRWEPVEVWGVGPRSWTIQGYGRPRGQSQGHRGEGYLTMPGGSREPHMIESDMRSRSRERSWDRNPEGYQPEVHFQEHKPKRFSRQQSDDFGHRRHHQGHRSQSYSYLPQDYPESRDHGQKERAQREYESIDQNERSTMMGPRAASQPLLVHEHASDWL